eukprot:TRINITY_DN13375_c1_g4_i1.p1 TRINITY_DN13375_c1_g4~~TRINITY_DN13375_c1_g4_i1.p1  ORF type:complete len:687 (+),score=223.55 TRINITY_DN13375_c1_g4_i1:74-2062(+)
MRRAVLLAAFAAAAAAAAPETRVDPADGRAYPLASFLDEYGVAEGVRRWNAAAPAAAQINLATPPPPRAPHTPPARQAPGAESPPPRPAAVGTYAVGTIGTWAARRELTLLLQGLARYDPARSRRTYVYCDLDTAEWTHVLFAAFLNLVLLPAILTGGTEPVKFHKVREMQHTKFYLLRRAFADGIAGMLYLDADVIPLAPLPPMPPKGALGVSVHGIRPHRELVVGRYNGGAFFVRDERTANLFRLAMERSEKIPERWSGHDQLALTDLCQILGGECFELADEFNVGWWRFSETHVKGGQRQTEALQPGAGQRGVVLWRGKRMLAAHTHLFRDESWYQEFNVRLRWAMRTAAHPGAQDYDEVSRPPPTVAVPRQPREDWRWAHVNDTARELVGLWGDLGLVIVVKTGANHMSWLEQHDHRGVLLYDRPSEEWWPPEGERAPGLYGQARPPGLPRALWWTFWGRRPALLHEFARSSWVRGPQGIPEFGRLPGYAKRDIRSLFYGTAQGPKQARTRWRYDWSQAVDDFRMAKGKRAPMPPIEYLAKLRRGRFGLVLRGYGAKCNRDIEYLALGVVPVAEAASDMTGYAEPLIEGVHYLRAGNPTEAARQISLHDTPEQWERMSRAGHAWYLRNAAPVGSFVLTRRLAARAAAAAPAAAERRRA